MIKKYFWLIPLLFVFFIYGVSVGTYKIFPFQQIKHVKDKLDRNLAIGPSAEHISGLTQSTFLQRLLIKKVKIGDQIGSGGGISNSGSILFLVTNKGNINAYDINRFENLNIESKDVPLNLEELFNSGIFTNDDVELIWYRVNGVYSEQVDSTTYRLFVSHNGFNSTENCITHNISSTELKLTDLTVNQVSNWNTIFTAEPCIDPNPEHYLSSHPYEGSVSGGTITEFNENQLLVTVGEYMRHGLNNAEAYSMDPAIPYGKMVLVDKNSGEWSIYSSGHRNAAGLFIDESGTIWSTENGPLGGDELNIIKPGTNYGWPLVSLGVWYIPTYRLTGGRDYGRHTGYQKPVFSWTNSIAPAALLRIQGNKFRYWSGDLIIGTRANQSLRRLRLDDSLRVIYDERIELGHRVRDMTSLPDGTIAIFTDDGYLIFIDDGGSFFHEMGPNEHQRLRKLENYDHFQLTSNRE